MTIKRIKQTAIPLLKKYDVVKASLFGSWARAEQRKGSDIDILVEFKEGKSLLDLIGLEIELQKILKRKIDVHTYDSIHPRLRNEVLNGQQIFYETNSETVS